MHKRGNPSGQRLLALHRYISAMEQGDAEIVAAVLHEAEQDQTLEQMILELNTVYQEIDQSMVSAQEAHEVSHHLFTPVIDQERSRLAQSNGIFSSHDHPLLTAETHQQRARRVSTMKEHETIPVPTLAETHLPSLSPVRKNRVGLLIQTLAAALIACALGGMILLAIAYQRAGTTAGQPAAKPHAIVALTTNNGVVYGLRADNGRQLWKFTAPKVQEGNSTGNRVTVQGQVVYALLGSQVYALRATDGTLLWHRSLFIESTQQDSYDTFLIDQNMLYVSGEVYGNQPIPQEIVYALHSNDGTVAWHSTGSVLSLLTAHAGIAYVVTEDKTSSNLDLRALRSENGTQLWHYPAEVISAVADNTTVYVYAGAPPTLEIAKEHKEEKTLIALNVQNGQVRWSVPIIANDSQALIIGQDKLFLEQSGNTSYQFCAYQTSNGKQAWCTPEQTMSPFPTPMTTSLVTNNAFYVLAVTRSNSGDFGTRLVGYRERDGKPLGWTQNIADPTSRNITTGNGLVFVSTANHVWAINSSGQQIWVYDNPQHVLPSGVGVGGFEAVSFGTW